MKIGTMVIRAYAWHAIVPGIIIDEEVEIHTTSDERDAFEMCHFIVQWSDGTQTREMYEELDTFLDNPHIKNLFNSTRRRE